jgi:cell division protein FtsW
MSLAAPSLPKISLLRRRDREVTEGVSRDTTLLGGAIACLLVIGLVMTFSASFVTSSQTYGGPYAIFLQHGQSVVLGTIALLVAARVDHRFWRRIALPFLAVALGLSLLVLVPAIGTEVAGARRWLDLGPVQFQPAELLKLSLPLALADLLHRRWRDLHAGDLRALLLPAVPLIAAAAGLVFVSPDLESAVLVAVIGLAVLWTAGLPWRLVGAATAAVAAVGLLGLTLKDFRGGRIAAWLDPFSDPANYGFQTVQGYYALGSGGWLGAGLGASRSKWLFLPNPHTDFIFAIIGEELGLVGTLTVLLLFAVLALSATRIARRAPDPFGRLAATGITTWILLQAAINMGSVVGLLPVTGVTLPLVSYGGTSLVITMLGLGMLLSIGHGANEAEVHELDAAAPPRGARAQRGMGR